MKSIVIAAAVLLSTPAIAGTYTSTIHGPNGIVTTTCSSTYSGRTCFTNVIPPMDSGPRVIQVEPMPNPGREPEMTEAERAAARRKSCESRSVQCLPEPAW